MQSGNNQEAPLRHEPGIAICLFNRFNKQSP